MQRAHVCAGLGIGFMLAASSTYAGQVELSVETRLGGDSNVFRQSVDKTDDGTFDISPRLGVHDDDEDVSYGFDYAPTYRNFFKTSGIDGVDHNANARTSWMISPVDKLEASGSYYNGRQFLFGTSDSGAGSTVSVNDRERIGISFANLGYRRALSPRLSIRGDGFFDDFDASGTSVNSQTDSRAYTGRISTHYALSPRAEIGLSASGRRRENRAVGPLQPNTRTNVWDVLAFVSYEITPTLSASVQVGPSFVRQQQIPGGTLFRKDETNSANVFAAASLQKEWQAGDLSFAYNRSEARSGNVASGSSINDDVQIALNHQLSDRLTLRVSGGWSRFKQISSPQESSSEFETNGYRTTGTVEFALSRRILLIGQYTYIWQETTSGISAATQSSSDVDGHAGYVGLRYTFEPLAY